MASISVPTSTSTSTSTRTSPSTPARVLLWALKIGAVLYAVAWVVGLLVPTPPLDVSSSSAEVLDAYASTSWTLAQNVLVHGVAALALGAVVLALARLAWPRFASVTSLGLGGLAVVLSLVQLALESVLARGGIVDGAGLWLVVTTLDGVKMLVLAAFVAVAAQLRDGGGVIRAIVTIAAASALVVAGIGYLLLIDPLMLLAYAALPLLIACVLAIAWTPSPRG